MKSFFLKSIVLAALIPLTFLACKDDEEDNMEATLSIETLAGRYKLTELTWETAITPKASLLGRLEPCMLDDIFELKADTTASIHDEGTACEPSSSHDFDYSITSNAVNLVGLYEDRFTGGTVIKWDGTTLVLSSKVNNDWTGNVSATVIGTLVKQPE